MTMVRYNQNVLPSMIREFLGDDFMNPFSDSGSTIRWYPVVDVYEEGNILKLDAELPGMKKENVKLEFKEDVLTISGERKDNTEKDNKGFFSRERRYGAFARSFRIGSSYDVTKIKASFVDGILNVEIPKKQETQPVSITIQ